MYKVTVTYFEGNIKRTTQYLADYCMRMGDELEIKTKRKTYIYNYNNVICYAKEFIEL